MSVVYRTQEELNDAVSYWTGILRLEDWEIVATISRYHEMPLENSAGVCRAHVHSKRARIFLMCADDNPNGADWTFDMENTLVHELLHLHTEGILPEDYHRASDIANEQAIFSIASALIQLHRRSP